jgi:hypothetical protein
MPSVGFEPTIPASERAKTVHALDRSATVTGFNSLTGERNEKKLKFYGKLSIQFHGFLF